jgi:FeS assembly SUF system protein
MDTNNEFLQLESEIVRVLKDIYDPEIPVNIYDLGLIYDINVDEENNVRILMTLTTPNCPIIDQLLEEIEQKIKSIEGVKSFQLKLTFDPPWDQSMLSEEARLELGFM